jgi:hypothetical protein
MKAYETSFGPDSSNSPSGDANTFTPVLRAALDPFLDLAKSASMALSDSAAHTIFQINMLLAVRSTISTYPFASATHLPPLSAALTTLRTKLLEIQHTFFLDNSGLRQLLAALSPTLSSPPPDPEHPNQHPAAMKMNLDLSQIPNLPSFQPAALTASSQQLDDFLPSALMDATDNLKRVRSAGLVKGVTEEAVEAFCRDFEFVESMIVGADEARGQSGESDDDRGKTERDEEDGREEEDQGYGEEKWSLRALFPRTTGEIRVLLS